MLYLVLKMGKRGFIRSMKNIIIRISNNNNGQIFVITEKILIVEMDNRIK